MIAIVLRSEGAGADDINSDRVACSCDISRVAPPGNTSGKHAIVGHDRVSPRN
jgi:hypothetical protein